MPFPIHISRTLSPSLHCGISSGHIESSAPFTSPTVSAGVQSSITWVPSLLANTNLSVILLGSYTNVFAWEGAVNADADAAAGASWGEGDTAVVAGVATTTAAVPLSLPCSAL